MASNTSSTWYLLRKRLEALLHWALPHWFKPLYSMVAFDDVPYHEAVARAARQVRPCPSSLAAFPFI